jgi:hypothetical protein
MPKPRERDYILYFQIRASDRAAFSRVISAVPKEVASFIQEVAQPAQLGAGGMRYSNELQRAYWIAHDRMGVMDCIAFFDVTMEQAAKIHAGIQYCLAAGNAPEKRAIADLYEQATGRKFYQRGY